MDNKHPTDNKKKGEGKEGKGWKKQKNKDGNGDMLKNTLQPDKFKLIARKSLKDNFAAILPHDWSAWTDRIKICARWHIKGKCYSNCSRVISHITKDIIPNDKRTAFLTYLTKHTKEKSKKLNWLFGLEPSGVQPPKRPQISLFFSRLTRWSRENLQRDGTFQSWSQHHHQWWQSMT